jgi:hypothetical protein
MQSWGRRIRVGVLTSAYALGLMASACGDGDEPSAKLVGSSGSQTASAGAGGGGDGAGAAAGGESSSSGAPALSAGEGSGGKAGEPGGLAGQAGGSGEISVSCWGAVGCYDANPCTVDVCELSESCGHTPQPDDTPCDDGDACTEGDACANGVCTGTPRASQAGLRGRLSAFGATGSARNSYEQLVAPLTSERALVLESVGLRQTRLVLVAVQDDSLAPLDELTLDMPYIVRMSPLYWKQIPEIQIVPLGGERVAIFGTDYGVAVIDTAADELQLLSHRAAPPDGQAFAAVGRDNWLWLCRTDQLEPYEVQADGTLRASPTLALNAICRDLAVSPDGKRLWAATMIKGLLALDVTTPGMPRPLGVSPVPAHNYFAVEERAGLLAAQQLEQSDQFGDIVVLSAESLKEVARFSPKAGRLPVSIDLLDASSFLVQWVELDASGGKLKLVRYHLGSASEPGVVGAEADWSTTTHAFDGANSGYDGWQPQPSPAALPAALGPDGVALVATEPGGQLLRVRADGATLLSGSANGGFSALTALAPDRLLAFGSRSQHLLSLADPDAPTLIDGGLLPMEARAGLHAWWGEVTEGVEPEAMLVCRRRRGVLRARADGLDVFDGPSARLVRLGGAVNELPAPIAEQRLEGPARLVATGRALYELAPTDEAGFSLRIFDAAGPSGLLHVHWQQRLEGSPSSLLGERKSVWTFWRFAADDAAGELLLAEPSASGETTYLRWFTRDDAGWQLAASAEHPLPPDALMLHGRRAALLVNGTELSVLERVGTTIVSRGTHVEPLGTVDDVVAFDERRVALSVRDLTPGASSPIRLRIFNAADLSPLADYDLDNEAQALTSQGPWLAIATGTGLRIAAPACSLGSN